MSNSSTKMELSEQEDDFKLEAPEDTPLVVPKVAPVAEVIEKKLKTNHQPGNVVKLNEDTKEAVSKGVDELMDSLFAAEAGSDEILTIQEFVRNLGNEEMSQEMVSNKILDKSLNQLQKSDEGSNVADALVDLRNLVSELDPSIAKNFSSKLLRKIPFVGKKIDNKIKSYQSSETQIKDIVSSLEAGKESLKKDNIEIIEERKKLWANMGKLEQCILATKIFSEKIKKALPEIAAEHPEKARIVQQDILFYVEQKQMDLLTNLAVNMQAYMSLDVASKNNVELIKGVERATSTTVQALKVSVMLAQLLTNQKNVAEKVTAVNEVTEGLILGTAKALNQQGVEISKAAMSSNLKPEVLNQAFDLVVQALDNIENYKIEALSTMEQTISNLDGTVSNMKKHLDVHREKEVKGIKKILEEKRDSNGIINLKPTKNKLG